MKQPTGIVTMVALILGVGLSATALYTVSEVEQVIVTGRHGVEDLPTDFEGFSSVGGGEESA